MTQNYYTRWKKHMIEIIGKYYPRSFEKTWDSYGKKLHACRMTSRQSAIACAELMKMHWQHEIDTDYIDATKN